MNRFCGTRKNLDVITNNKDSNTADFHYSYIEVF